MIQQFHNSIDIHTQIANSDIHIWYSCIPTIMSELITSGTYHNCGPMVNEILKKESFAFSCFNPKEISTINGFKAVKKQKEWMAGRYLIKQMLRTLFLKSDPLDLISLSYQDEGAPYVKNHPEIELSLSHSHDYTIAAVTTTPERTIGIDIEKIQTKPDSSFLKTAFTQAEIESMADDTGQIYRHWTIKEAYLKYIKKGFHESLHKVEIINNTIIHHGRKKDLSIRSFAIDPDYVVSLVND